MANTKNQIIKNSIFSYAAKFVPIIFSLIYTIILADILGPKEYGLFIYLSSIGIGFLNLFGASLLNEIIVNFTAQSGSKKLFKKIFILQFVLTTAVFIGIILLGSNFIINLDGSNIYLFLFAAFIIFLSPLNSTFEALNKGTGHFERIFYAITLEHLVNLIMILAFVQFLGFGIIGAFIAKYISLGFSALIYIFYLKKTEFQEKPIDKKIVKKYFTFGITGEFLAQILEQFETIAMGMFIAPAVLGVYFIATKIANIALGAPSSALIDVLFQLNSSNYENKKKIEKYTAICIKGSFFIAIIFSIILAIIAYPMIITFFPKYVGAFALIPLLIIDKCLKPFEAVKTVLNSINKVGQRTVQRMITVTIGIILILILVPLFGIEGLIVARIITYLSSSITAYILLWKYNGIKIDLIPKKSDVKYFYHETKSLTIQIFQKIKSSRLFFK